jgi:hypothetical protein
LFFRLQALFTEVSSYKSAAAFLPQVCGFH